MTITVAYNEYKELKNQAIQAGIPFLLTVTEFIAWYKEHGIDINNANYNFVAQVSMSRKDESKPFEIDNLELAKKKPVVAYTYLREMNCKDYTNPITILDQNKPALIIGNGKSRLKVDLDKIKDKFNTYGSNAIYRDFMPDVITALDPGIFEELVTNKVYKQTQMFTRYNPTRLARIVDEQMSIRLIEFPGQYLDSGNSNIYLASQHDNNNKIYMLGFDYISDDNTLNNVYAGTANYGLGKHIEPYLIAKWEQRLQHILNINPNKEFIRVKLNNYTPKVNAANFLEITLEEWESQYAS
jgi:hypothetical protein